MGVAGCDGEACWMRGVVIRVPPPTRRPGTPFLPAIAGSATVTINAAIDRKIVI
ncbi:hypothetical protein [Leptothermofonsia sp. ETS-13]|uniref:hypothetical protein n=1 Tax=Leptothermofonsia sp. ETS-13 TaxID=3035696 RepID=UPI003BA2F6CF